MDKERKRALIITYYWPPSGGSGVQRWLKFVKYLPQFGWEPYVFTPENPSFDIKDPSLLDSVPDEAEVIHFPIWEPYNAFLSVSRLFGARKKVNPVELVGKKASFFNKIATWLRGNLLVPDPRVFWVRPASKFLDEFIVANQIEKVITTGPPHSIHLIGERLKKKHPRITWLADFRDPWSEWGLLDSLRVSALVRGIHRKLERKVLQRADIVTTITPFYVRHFQRLGGRKVELLTNGYDDDDFLNLKIVRSEKFIIRHVGIVNEKCDPRPFMLAIRRAAMDHPEFRGSVRVEFVGEVHNEFQKFVTGDKVLHEATAFIPSVSHRQLVSDYGSAAMLLLVLEGYKDAEGYMPGKLFEYAATGLPILGVGPVDGDAAGLLAESGAGAMLAASDIPGIIDFVLRSYMSWKNHVVPRANGGHRQYSRKNLTARLVELLDKNS